VGAKLVIVMVGLPARGKSYVTEKIARYLNWLQHDTRIFNVGERRRIAAGVNQAPDFESIKYGEEMGAGNTHSGTTSTSVIPYVNIEDTSSTENHNALGPPAIDLDGDLDTHGDDSAPAMAQDASFFDPENVVAAQIREQVAMSTLDELLDYVLFQGGSVGILDATNSTLERRKHIMKKIRERAGTELGVLFLESQCLDKNVSAVL
jgi:6-phosphofructo-2-kinase